jgi:hypothetical protein
VRPEVILGEGGMEFLKDFGIMDENISPWLVV